MQDHGYVVDIGRLALVCAQLRTANKALGLSFVKVAKPHHYDRRTALERNRPTGHGTIGVDCAIRQYLNDQALQMVQPGYRGDFLADQRGVHVSDGRVWYFTQVRPIGRVDIVTIAVLQLEGMRSGVRHNGR